MDTTAFVIGFFAGLLIFAGYGYQRPAKRRRRLTVIVNGRKWAIQKSNIHPIHLN